MLYYTSATAGAAVCWCTPLRQMAVAVTVAAVVAATDKQTAALISKMHRTHDYSFIADILPTSLDESSGTATNSVYPLVPSEVEDRPPVKHYPYTFPYFLFPPSKIPMALASNGGDDRGPFEVYAYNISSHYAEFEEMSTVHNNEHHKHLHHNSHSEHNSHHHNINRHGTNNNNNGTSTMLFDHEWRRQQYNLARAKIGEKLSAHSLVLFFFTF